MTNILALPRKHSSSWNNRPRDRKTLQDIAGSHPAANNESQKQEKTCTPLHPATPSSHKVLPPFSPQSIMQMGEHPHKRVEDRAKPAAQTSGHTRTPLPAFTNARSTDVAAFEHSLSLILLARLPPSSDLMGRAPSTCTALKAPWLRPAPPPSAPSRCTQQHQAQEITCTCTPAHTPSCPGLPHSTPRVSNSRDTA